MRKIHYAGTTVTTDEVLAGELELYAAELARHGSADAVSVPGFGPDGAADHFDILLGPASQLLVGSGSHEGELDVTEAIAEVRRRRSALLTAPVAVADDVRGSLIDDL